MNPIFLSNAELLAAFASVKKASLTGERITSWSSAGTSVSKAYDSGTALAARGNILAREIAYRIHEGKIDAAEAPGISGMPRPQGERLCSFAT